MRLYLTDNLENEILNNVLMIPLTQTCKIKFILTLFFKVNLSVYIKKLFMKTIEKNYRDKNVIDLLMLEKEEKN